MSQVVTLNLPEPLFQLVERRAHQMKRTVEDELLAAAASLAPALPVDQERELAQLAFLTDAELWQAARTVVPKPLSQRMQTLADKQSSGALTDSEGGELEQLLLRCDRVMLVRAQAAVLLKRRGFDIRELSPEPAVP